MPLSKGFFALSLVSIAVLAGCGQQSETRETTANTTADTAAVAPVAPPTEPAMAGMPQWLAELRQEESAMGESVEQGRVGEVHDRAVKLQTIMKQIGQNPGSATPEQQQQLGEHLIAADRLVNELHDAGDAGDLTKTKAKFQEFQTHLRAIEGVFGVPTP